MWKATCAGEVVTLAAPDAPAFREYLRTHLRDILATEAVPLPDRERAALAVDGPDDVGLVAALFFGDGGDDGRGGGSSRGANVGGGIGASRGGAGCCRCGCIQGRGRRR